MLGVSENGKSVSGVAWNRTTSIIYSNEVERIFSLSFVRLSTVFTLCAQLLVLVTIIKSPKLHNAHFYLLGVYCCIDITVGSLRGAFFITLFVDGEMPTSVCQAVSTLVIACILGQAAHTRLLSHMSGTYSSVIHTTTCIGLKHRR